MSWYTDLDSDELWPYVHDHPLALRAIPPRLDEGNGDIVGDIDKWEFIPLIGAQGPGLRVGLSGRKNRDTAGEAPRQGKNKNDAEEREKNSPSEASKG
jgi:hypothetical protein